MLSRQKIEYCHYQKKHIEAVITDPLVLIMRDQIYLQAMLIEGDKRDKVA